MKEIKEIQNSLLEEKKSIEDDLAQIEDSKKEIVNKKNELVEAQKIYIEKQDYEQSKMNELYALENEKSTTISELSDKEKEVAEQIGDLVNYNSELQAELDKIFADINNQGISKPNEITGSNGTSGSNETVESPGTNNTGSEDTGSNDIGYIGNPSEETFLRPGNGIVTDTYGPRTNPVTGEKGFHSGVDLGDPYGANVKASKSGKVVYAGWISGYGNTVIIDHGNGIQTLYGHNSKLLVSVGQTVSRGDTISLVGSTGQSTGPHIHWEIRVNGQHTNPMEYV